MRLNVPVVVVLVAAFTAATIPAQPTTPMEIPHPAVKSAEEAQKIAASRGAQAQKLLVEFKERVQKARELSDLNSQNLAWESAQKLLPTLREQGQWVIDHYPEAEGAMLLWEESLVKAGTACKELGKIHKEKFAAEEPLDKLKKGYLKLGDSGEKLGIAFLGQAKQVGKVRKELEEKIQLVQRTTIFLDRLQQFVKVYEPARLHGEEVDAFLKELKDYLNNFDETLKSFGELADVIASTPAVPSTVPDNPGKAVPVPLPVNPGKKISGLAPVAQRAQVIQLQGKYALINKGSKDGLPTAGQFKLVRDNEYVGDVTIWHTELGKSWIHSPTITILPTDQVVFTAQP